MAFSLPRSPGGSLLGPTPRPSRISRVIARLTTSREARSFNQHVSGVEVSRISRSGVSRIQHNPIHQNFPMITTFFGGGTTTTTLFRKCHDILFFPWFLLSERLGIAQALAVGAYRAMKGSPSLFRRMPPSPRQPSVSKQPAGKIPFCKWM